MITRVVPKVDPDAYRAIAQILDPRPSRSFLMWCGMTSAVTMHNTQRHRRRQRYNKRYGEVMYDDGHLFVSFVMGEDHRAVFAWVIARKLGTLNAVCIGEIGTQYVWWVATSLYVYQEDRVVCRIVRLHLQQMRLKPRRGTL